MGGRKSLCDKVEASKEIAFELGGVGPLLQKWIGRPPQIPPFGPFLAPASEISENQKIEPQQ